MTSRERVELERLRALEVDAGVVPLLLRRDARLVELHRLAYEARRALNASVHSVTADEVHKLFDAAEVAELRFLRRLRWLYLDAARDQRNGRRCGWDPEPDV